CPCFGSLHPPLAALTFAASSIICAFGLASAAPRSPYRHLELCGIALKQSILFNHTTDASKCQVEKRDTTNETNIFCGQPQKQAGWQRLARFR
ncbi:MAG: hypothetical protein PUJ34_09530, partial [Subdoligranulum sp.]|nr:hypothetical protein [Subdoligranulum sp.]